MVLSISAWLKIVTGRNRSKRRGSALHICAGSEKELEAVFRLNQQCFPEAWSQEGLRQALNSGYDLWLCLEEGRLQGYILSQDIIDEVHILQLAVAAEARRQGIGTILVLHLLKQKRDMAFMLLEVRASNVAAIRLYEKTGFVIAGVRKGYYQPRGEIGREDAVQMRFDLDKRLT